MDEEEDARKFRPKDSTNDAKSDTSAFTHFRITGEDED